MKRYELTQAPWERIAPLLPSTIGDLGRSGADNRKGGRLAATVVLSTTSRLRHYNYWPTSLGRMSLSPFARADSMADT